MSCDASADIKEDIDNEMIGRYPVLFSPHSVVPFSGIVIETSSAYPASLIIQLYGIVTCQNEHSVSEQEIRQYRC